jgi:hypothetical protein
MLPKNRAALLNEKKNLPTGPLFQMQPAQFSKQDLSRFIEK